MRKLTKKGYQLTEVPQIAVVFLVLAVVLAIGATVLTSVQSTQCTYGHSQLYGCLNATGGTGGVLGTTYASNITQAGLSAQVSLASWQGTWVVIVAAAVILGIIGTYLMFKG